MRAASKDEDDMASDSSTVIATQQSIKAYVDRRIPSTWYNAASFGSGTTDVEIQAACDAVNVAGGGVVYVPSGNWIISTTIGIYSNTHLTGDGYGSGATLLYLANGSNTHVTAKGTPTIDGGDTDVIISNLRIDGNRANQTTSTSDGIYALGSRWTVENCLIKSTAGEGIVLQDCVDSVVRNCFFSGIELQNPAIGCGGTSDRNRILGNEFESCLGGAINISGQDYFLINNNTFKDNAGVPITFGIGGSNFTTVIGNRLVDNGGGISLFGNNNSISGNTLDNSSGITWSTGGASNYNTVTGNTVANSTSATTGGITVRDDNSTASSYNSIIGNTCFNNKWGLYASNKHDYNTYIGNACYGNTTADIDVAARNNIIRYNPGYKTEGKGTTTLANGQTSVTVTHGSRVIIPDCDPTSRR